jgi:DNA-binding MarR family transcriptional regulator
MEIQVLTFAEAKQPEYKEKKGEGYMQYGQNNDYPQYLLDLFNKSAKHNAIVRGKVNYIVGNGWASEQPIVKQVNREETLNDLTKKVALDLELFGGAYIQVIWGVLGETIAELWHCDYTKIRTNKDNTQFWYKEDWKANKEKAEVYSAFNPKNPTGVQILYVKEYRPGMNVYSLPGYFGALNYIESDVEVSKHVLGNAQTGFSASKLITLPNGEPSPDEKRAVSRQFDNMYTGADGKKYLLAFVNDATRKPIVDDLGASDLTKEDFSRVDELIQTNIFSGHQITSPDLFGIAVPGQLGNRQQMRDSYEIFNNTYVRYKQMQLEGVFNMLAQYAGITEELKIVPTDPIGIEFTENVLIQNMSKDEIREMLNLPPLEVDASNEAQRVTDGIAALSPLVANKVLESMTKNEIRALVALKPTIDGDVIPSVVTTEEPMSAETSVNEHIKGLKGREWQNMQRIIRDFNKGKITREQASSMLKGGYALTDEEVSTWLGAEEEQFSEADFQVFFEFGEDREAYEVIKSKTRFSDDADFEMFADVTQLQSNILDLIVKDKRITPEVIADTLKEDVGAVKRVIDDLIEKGFIKTKEIKQGKGIDSNVIIERELTQPIGKIVEAIKPQTTQILIRYTYEWKAGFNDSDLDTSREFCKYLVTANKFYTRSDIEQMSARLGYSVWDRRGGWYTKPGTNTHSPSCRHEWRSNIVKRK